MLSVVSKPAVLGESELNVALMIARIPALSPPHMAVLMCIPRKHGRLRRRSTLSLPAVCTRGVGSALLPPADGSCFRGVLRDGHDYNL